MKPHKHAALIKLWADNPAVTIQCRAPSCGRHDAYWNDIEHNESIMWLENLEYRIKPKTIKYRISLHKNGNGNREAYTYSWSDPSYVKDIELTSETFVRWLTDWIEVVVD